MVNLNKTIAMSLADRIVSARKKTGITQKVMAGRLGIAVASLNRYERGVREVDIKVLKLIAEITEKPIEWFFDENTINTNYEEEPLKDVEISKEEEKMFLKDLLKAQALNVELLLENKLLRAEIDAGGVIKKSQARERNGN